MQETRWLATAKSGSRILRLELVTAPPSFQYTVWKRDGRNPSSEWSVLATNFSVDIEVATAEAERIAKSFLENEDVLIPPLEWEEVPA
jgi:hypothetical protein